MTAEKQAIIDKLGLSADQIARVAGVSEKTARKWIEGELPESVFRLLCVVYGEARPEDYRV